MATATIVQDVIDGVKDLVAFIIDELGNFAHALALNIMHDIETFMGDPARLSAQHLADLWRTAKDQIVTAWDTLVGDFEAKVAGLVDLLKNINWVMVADAVVGISESTLTSLARVGAQMAVAGVLVAF